MDQYLVVEDNDIILEVISDILVHHGVAVTPVHNSTDALEKAREAAYTAIIIDLKLPDMSGWDLLKEIRKFSTTPCIAITAYDNVKVQQEAQKAGFAGYFPKPINEREFMGQLRSVLQNQ
jgi:two-component system response regulator CpxR